MKEYYYYLISSLPSLEFGMKTPFSYEDFLISCEGQLTGSDTALIKKAKIELGEDVEDGSLTLREWKDFNISLRNELARWRAIKHSKDPAKHVRGEYYIDPYKSGFAQWLSNQESPIEAEIALERFRWEKLEELQRYHYFDIDYLVVYALKLQILERWDRINSEGGMEVLEELVRE